MSNVDNTPATIKELQAACPDASAEFLVDQLAKDASVEQALRAQNAGLSKQVEELKRKVPNKRATHASGNEPLNDLSGSQASGSGNATEDWNDQIAGLTQAGTPRRTAVSIVNKRNPGLREQVLAEANA